MDPKERNVKRVTVSLIVEGVGMRAEWKRKE